MLKKRSDSHRHDFNSSSVKVVSDISNKNLTETEDSVIGFDDHVRDLG